MMVASRDREYLWIPIITTGRVFLGKGWKKSGSQLQRNFQKSYRRIFRRFPKSFRKFLGYIFERIPNIFPEEYQKNIRYFNEYQSFFLKTIRNVSRRISWFIIAKHYLKNSRRIPRKFMRKKKALLKQKIKKIW